MENIENVRSILFKQIIPSRGARGIISFSLCARKLEKIDKPAKSKFDSCNFSKSE